MGIFRRCLKQAGAAAVLLDDELDASKEDHALEQRHPEILFSVSNQFKLLNLTRVDTTVTLILDYWQRVLLPCLYLWLRCSIPVNGLNIPLEKPLVLYH